MASKKKAQRDRDTVETPVHERGIRQTALLAVTAVAGVVIGMALWNAQQQGWFANTVPASVVTPAGQAVEERVVDLQKLKGQWVREDGGYVMDIKSIAEDGKADVAYLNPKPIHVEKAEAWQDAGRGMISVKLQDVNYPGSTYDLHYDALRDQLRGLYYQAVEKQHFEVIFQRKP
jgi:hypothetical protein